jgi:hypothetical protein
VFGLFYYKCTKAKTREATRRNLEISTPALAEFVLLMTPAGEEVVGVEEAGPEGADDTAGATGAAEIVMGILTFV